MDDGSTRQPASGGNPRSASDGKSVPWDAASARHLLEWVPSAMLVVDAEGRIEIANAQAVSMFQYPLSELIGLEVDRLLPERFAAVHARHRKEFLDDARPRAMGANRDLFARRRDGVEFPVEIGLTPVQFARGQMVVATIADITERHRMEERFRRVVEFAPSAMVMVDAGGLIVLVNAQTESMFGFARDDLIGKPVEVLVPLEMQSHHGSLRNGYFAQPEPRPMGGGRELFGRRADGSEFPVEIGLNPIESDEGVMVLASIADITERQRSRQVLESALKEKTALLNEVHHRVKNNLQVISSLLNLQASYTDDPRLRATLEESQGRVKAMALTHQLLYEGKDFSRLDLGNFLGRLVQLLGGAHRAGSSGVGLRLELPATPIHLELDRTVPCALLVNELVSNAFKHAFPDGRCGEIVVALNLSDATHVELSVSDDGIGLPPEFDLDQVKSLGLQLVPLFADQLQARLAVDGGKGSRFLLSFPIQSVPGEKK